MNAQAAAEVVEATMQFTPVSMVALGLVFFAVYMFTKAFFSQEATHNAKQLLGEEEKNRKAPDPIIKYSRPIFSRYVVPIVQDMQLDKQRKEAKQKLIAAGLTDELTPDEFMAMKISLIFLAPLVTFAVNYFGEFELHWLLYVIMSPAGYFYPDYMCYEKKKMRQKGVKRAMPFIIDLLALSTEAGLDFVGAIGKVVQKASPSPLVEELSQALKEMKVGSSRAEALRDMAIRLDMQQISSFVSILISADEMGASIGKVLRQQSETIRIERTLAAEKEGAKAASKIMAPTFFFILPAIALTVGAPFMMDFMKSGGLGAGP